jgi:Fe-S-cluster containining protein
VIDSYIHDKHDLYSRHSRFACEGACPRFGCKTDLVVGVSLLEIRQQAELLRRPTLDVFRFACKLSPFIDGGFDRVRVRIALKKPCVYLENSRQCAIHSVRPAACALFPEFLGILSEEERQKYIDGNGVGHYPCVRHDALCLTPERAEAVRRLRRIYEKEVYATELCLFGLAGFSVDLREEVLALRYSGAGPVPYARTEEALERVLRDTGVYDRVLAKVAAFDAPGHNGDFLAALSIWDAIAEAHV